MHLHSYCFHYKHIFHCTECGLSCVRIVFLHVCSGWLKKGIAPNSRSIIFYLSFTSMFSCYPVLGTLQGVLLVLSLKHSLSQGDHLLPLSLFMKALFCAIRQGFCINHTQCAMFSCLLNKCHTHFLHGFRKFSLF